MISKKVLIIIICLLLAGVLLFVFTRSDSLDQTEDTLSLPGRNDTVPQLPIMFDYGTKIVYTTNVTINKSEYIGDCETRGGIFNTCGNTCKPGAQICTAECALTCELK